MTKVIGGYIIYIGGDNLKENIKTLREHLGLSQKAFADRLMLTPPTISRIEKGDRKINDRLIVQICNEFNVNEEWLRSGEGEMFKGSDDFELASMMGKMFSGDDNFLKNVFLTFARLNDSEREVVKKIIKELNKE